MIEKLLNCALVTCIVYCVFTLITILGSFAKVIPASGGLLFLLITVGFVTVMTVLVLIVTVMKKLQ